MGGSCCRRQFGQGCARRVRAFGNTALEAADDVARAGAVDLQENISALSRRWA